MAPFCHFWRMTPAEFWALSYREYVVLSKYGNDFIKTKERGGGDR